MRRHDRKQAAHDQANAKVLAAQRDLDRCKANACGLRKAATDIQIAARQHEAAATAADPQAVDLACDWEWAEQQYLKALLAPQSDTWFATCREKVDAAKRAQAAWYKARDAKLVPLGTANDEAHAAVDAFEADPRSHEQSVWQARTEAQVLKESSRTYLEYQSMSDAWPWPEAARALMREQDACYMQVHRENMDWEFEQSLRRRYGCLCDPACECPRCDPPCQCP